MAMGGAGRGQQTSQINMTPMIDVLLVLIIIFMVITPLTPTGLRTLLPQPPPTQEPEQPRQEDIVITVGRDGAIFLNGGRSDVARLPDRLEQIFQARGDAVIFVRGDKALEFRRIAEVIDIAKGAGLQRVALMTQ
jgi:biopolymer transport protein TolR